MVFTYDALLSSFTYHIEQAGKKLRKQGLYAREMLLFANTNRFKDDYMSCTTRIVFPQALDSYLLMAKYLGKAVLNIYKPGFGYKKSGIILPDLITEEYQTKDLFANYSIKHDKLLPTVEAIKKQYGKDAIGIASARLSDEWLMTRDKMSRNYTTDLDDILEVT